MKTKIHTIIGTRPEIIKMSQLIPLLDGNFEHRFIFTSQHYSKNMVDIFLDELGVREPDIFLGVKSSDHSSLKDAIRPKIAELKPDYVLTYGDTNSTLAAAMATKELEINLIHVEAGLRSFDNSMPEEMNRIKTDGLSDYLFTPTELTKHFLGKEGITNNVFVVGNTVVDACLTYSKIANEKSKILDELKIEKDNYVLVTAHRQENVDNPERLLKILNSLSDLPLTVIFPIHPRTKKRVTENNYKIHENIRVIDPLGYLDFLKLMMHSSLIITDSGGIQEEAITLKIPCLTIRTSTERWETIITGGNFLVGVEPDLVKYHAKMILESGLGRRMRKVPNPYGDGTTSEKIIEILR